MEKGITKGCFSANSNIKGVNVDPLLTPLGPECQADRGAHGGPSGGPVPLDPAEPPPPGSRVRLPEPRGEG